MNLFKVLTPDEETEFRTWARENYVPFTEIKGIWHLVVQEECARINAATQLDLVSSAAEAIESFGEDELERYAEEHGPMVSVVLDGKVVARFNLDEVGG